VVTWRNDDVDWNQWPVETYLAENYRRLHRADAAVIDHHSRFFRQLAPDGIDLSVEVGAGPNLYPLMLQAAACRQIHALDRSSAGLGYLRRQLGNGPDPHWEAFYRRCREQNPTLPVSLPVALSRVEVVRGDARQLPEAAYGLASMHFVAETMSEDPGQFLEHCASFCRSVSPGGYLVAAFMENLGRYQLGGGSSTWPGLKVDSMAVHDAFAPHTSDLVISRIDDDPGLPDYGYTGMVLVTARRAPAR
jgi:hypothetical protein